MAYPTEEQIKNPLLILILALGSKIWFSEDGEKLESILADHFGLTKEQRASRRPELTAKGQRVWRMHVQWARKKLVEEGLLGGKVRDLWILTEEGSEKTTQLLREDQALMKLVSAAAGK